MSGAPVATPSRAQIHLVLAAAVLAMSSSAVLVRFMAAAPLAIAAWRMAGAAALTAPTLRRRPALPDALRLTAGAVLLAIHFATWFAAVQQTTVLHAAVLVALVPLWTGMGEWLAGRPPSRGFAAGVLVALCGVGAMASMGRDGTRATWTGDGLALVAGVAYAGVLALTRGARARLGATEVTAWLCGGAAAMLLLAAGVTGTDLALDGTTAGLLVLAVLGPQLVGHQGVAWVVRWMPASRVSAALLLEPAGSTLLAALLLGERPGPGGLAGAAVAVIGVAIAQTR